MAPRERVVATSASPASSLARRFRVGSSELLAGPGFNNPAVASELPIPMNARSPRRARRRRAAVRGGQEGKAMATRVAKDLRGCAVVPPQASSRYGSPPQVQGKKQRRRKVFARRKTQAAGAG